MDVPEGQFVRTNSSAQRRSLGARIRKRLNRMGLPVKVMDG
jgi:hypothetical protein